METLGCSRSSDDDRNGDGGRRDKGKIKSYAQCAKYGKSYFPTLTTNHTNEMNIKSFASETTKPILRCIQIECRVSAAAVAFHVPQTEYSTH